MNPKNVYQRFLESGTAWADAHGAAELLEGTLKSLLAQYTLEAKSSENCSVTEAEKIALSCADYRDAVRDSVQARTAANRAKVQYEAVKAYFDAARTAEASERAAMRSAT